MPHQYFDLHTHTCYSADGEKSELNTPKSKAMRARELGLSGIALTDHFDIYEKGFTFPPPRSDTRYFDVEKRRSDILAVRKELESDGFNVFYGVEFGTQFNAPGEVPKILAALGDLDIIVGSVHRTHGGFAFYLSAKANFEGVSDSEIKSAFDDYLADLLWQAKSGEFDTLAHCTYPFRYTVMCGKEHIASVKDYYDEYRQIFRILIEKGKALEINTAGLAQPIHETSPGNDLLKIYRDMGGELITIGSDAHRYDSIGFAVKDTYEVLRGLGFKFQCVFKRREMSVLPL